MTAEDATVVELKGMPKNPARDPAKRPKEGKGSIGDVAFKDAVIIVAIAWAFLLFLAISLRHHNV
jgi:hypothetical protein